MRRQKLDVTLQPMHAITPTATDYGRTSSSVTTAQDEAGITLLHAGSGQVYSANHTGASIWNALLERRSPSEIALAIAREHDIPTGEALEHVFAFVAELMRAGFLEREGER